MPRTDRHAGPGRPGGVRGGRAAQGAVLVALVWALLGVAAPPAWSQTTTTTTTTGPTAELPGAVPVPTTAPDGGAAATTAEAGAGATAPSTAEPPTTEPATDAGPTTSSTSPEPTTSTTQAVPAREAAAAVPVQAPEGFTDEQWRRVRNVVQACGTAPGAVCDRVFDWTGNRTVAESAQWLFDIPLRIVIILAVAVALNHFVRRAIARHLHRLTERSRADALADPSNVHRGARRMATASATLGSTATAAIIGIAGLVSLSELGIDLGPMLAGAGIAGIAIGFGAQNLVRDVLAGLFVILEDQYGVGDTIDAGEATGTVEEFTLRVTKLRDVEGTLWFIPNGTIPQVGNKTQMWARAILDIEVAYAADHRRAGDLIKATADRIWREQRPGERIIEEPELWGVERLAESGVVIRLAVKSAPAEQWKVARTLRSEIKEALDAEGFEIPFPQRTIWVRSDGDRLPGDRDQREPPGATGP